MRNSSLLDETRENPGETGCVCDGKQEDNGKKHSKLKTAELRNGPDGLEMM